MRVKVENGKLIDLILNWEIPRWAVEHELRVLERRSQELRKLLGALDGEIKQCYTKVK